MATVLPDATAASSVISERQWERILERIKDRTVIPVIGEQLTVMSRGDPPTETSLADYLAERLELPGPPTASINEIAIRYLRKNPKGLDDLYADIFQALPTDDAFPLPAPLKHLAEIRDFGLFVTTSFDPYMALALNEVRFGRRASSSTRVLSYEHNGAVDIPEKFRELDHPLVYHLLGKAQALPVYAVTDEDMLEFVHALQAPECRPVNLAEALREQRLLILGTRLTGWLTRFFLRISSGDRLRDARRADVIVDPGAHADADQLLFFENFGEVKLLPMPPARFVEELAQRWKAMQDPKAVSGDARHPEPAPGGAGEVFLSYASEDLAAVKALRERLEREAGVRVWLDKDSLRGGEEWERHIADALRGCAVCVPVISASATSGEFRYVRAEWRAALRLQDGRPADRTFIIPLLIDDTSPNNPAVDAELRDLHWRRSGNAEDMGRFIAEVRAEVEKSRSP
jgi:hypothetical protein